MPSLYLHDELKPLLGKDAFATVWILPGETYRQVPRRRTFRFVESGRAYFAKVHDGVGWHRIIKDLVSLKPPVLGARNEFAACRHLAAAGVRTPRVVAYGERGINPATRRSFVICEALDDFTSLKDIAESMASGGFQRLVAPTGTATETMLLRRRLIREVALITRYIHDAGVNHRDYYIWHLMADSRKLTAGEVELAVIDLHRASVRARVPNRWRVRDLAALLYSSSSRLHLNRCDRFRFITHYTGERPSVTVRRRRRFWEGVVRRSTRLAKRRDREPDGVQ